MNGTISRDFFQVRLAQAADAPTVALHRARMFQDMGEVPPAMFESLRVAAQSWTELALERGEYIGWMVKSERALDTIVAGAGVQLRQVPPHPRRDDRGEIIVAKGAHAIVLNVFVEPEWRRRGLAALLLQHIIDWAKQERLDRLVLHSSEQGRKLYERMGFVATNEMRYVAGK